jgi:hypothetical protein
MGDKIVFLIEYDKGLFVNAEEISHVGLRAGSITFSIRSYGDNEFVVSENHRDTFCNHLQALNANLTNIESFWHKLNT